MPRGRSLDVGRLRQLDVGAGDLVYVSGYGLAPGGSGFARARWVTELPDEVGVLVDPGPLGDRMEPAVRDAVLARADWWSANAREATALTGRADPTDAAHELLRRRGSSATRRRRPPGTSTDADATPTSRSALSPEEARAQVFIGRRGGVVVRTGPSGCVLVEAGGAVHAVAAPQVRAVDTSGAGDVHAGVFIASLGSGADALNAAVRANAAAAISVTRPGPDAAPSAAELTRFLTAGLAMGLRGSARSKGPPDRA